MLKLPYYFTFEGGAPDFAAFLAPILPLAGG
jgi:hypothetical protein